LSSEDVGHHFDLVAPGYDKWKAKAHYYYEGLKASLAEIVPAGSRVAEVGCATGDILDSLRPSEGLGLDISPEMIEIARAKHPDLKFVVHDLMDGPWNERFDFVVAADVAEHVPDLAKCMASMAGMLTPEGRIVLVTANPAWGPVLHAAERLKLKMPEGDHSWRSRQDLSDAATTACLVEVAFDRSLLMPKDVVGLRRLDSAAWAAGLRQRFGLMQRMVFGSSES
jgi:2-polyprenyl-3-methyl-5-hydroxy-6-metoxy-1,4-benzoquinol methylase